MARSSVPSTSTRRAPRWRACRPERRSRCVSCTATRTPTTSGRWPRSLRQGCNGEASRAGFVTASNEVLPEFREYERFNTTALNAYIGPLIDGYLARLQAAVAERGYRGPVFIMTSNGGVATAERARRLPVATVLSGPAGGVAAAADLGGRLGIPNLITCDMGGTSTDVCLIEDLVVPLTNEQFVGPYANRTPQTEINAVGAGGGSVAWMDAGDILMVGPRSAGADPGPPAMARAGGSRR